MSFDTLSKNRTPSSACIWFLWTIIILVFGLASCTTADRSIVRSHVIHFLTLIHHLWNCAIYFVTLIHGLRNCFIHCFDPDPPPTGLFFFHFFYPNPPRMEMCHSLCTLTHLLWKCVILFLTLTHRRLWGCVIKFFIPVTTYWNLPLVLPQPPPMKFCRSLIKPSLLHIGWWHSLVYPNLPYMGCAFYFF
jgi:hypothetical protein